MLPHRRLQQKPQQLLHTVLVPAWCATNYLIYTILLRASRLSSCVASFARQNAVKFKRLRWRQFDWLPDS
jgi:hypothetical protein